MTRLNIFLLIIFILVHVIAFDFYRSNQRRIKQLKKIGIGQIFDVLVELSLSFTWQTYIFYSKNNYLFEITKYQMNNLWGLNLIIDLDKNKDIGKLTRFLEKDKIDFLLVDKQERNVKGLVINNANDIKKTTSQVVSLIEKYYNIEPNNPIFYKHEKKHSIKD